MSPVLMQLVTECRHARWNTRRNEETLSSLPPLLLLARDAVQPEFRCNHSRIELFSAQKAARVNVHRVSLLSLIAGNGWTGSKWLVHLASTVFKQNWRNAPQTVQWALACFSVAVVCYSLADYLHMRSIQLLVWKHAASKPGAENRFSTPKTDKAEKDA